jgi:hypothetical protein
VKELLRDGRLFTLSGVGERRLGALQRGVRLDDQPALGHAIVAYLKALITRSVIEPMPGVPREGLRDHLRDRVQGVGNPCDEAEHLEVGSIVLMVEF